MKWVRQDVQTYYDVFKCSNCGDEIMADELGVLPCYCKNCEQECDN